MQKSIPVLTPKWESRPRKGAGAVADLGLGSEQLDTLVTVLDLVRAGAVRTPARAGPPGRAGCTVVTQRLAQLIDCGLVEDGDFGPVDGRSRTA